MWSALVAALWLATPVECNSVSSCNRVGTAALQAGRHAEALEAFHRQIDLAETAWKQAGPEDQEPLAHGLQIALNNAALTVLRSGDCARARAWLQAADAAHRATQANLRALQQRCTAALRIEPLGEFLQYAGHGAWNSVSIRETGDETLRLDAYWMRIGRGPLSEWGAAAIGDLTGVSLHPDGAQARGRYDGLDPAIPCELQVRYLPGGLDIAHTAESECRMGGAGAELQGRYWRVSDPEPLPDAEDAG
ncbi:MAG: hypothetical protein MUE46_04235 [Xanthomonadales bacterium]|jgi:hypothetical protein|nr:hypothetical protein [Xanthomonadales bacterium]